MTETGAAAPGDPGASRGLGGGFYTLLGSACSFGIQLVALVVLSRLLQPDDFGLVAMAVVFVSLAALLRDFGLPTAGLQARSLSPQQASNLFWMNLVVSVTVAVALVCLTPVLSALYREPRLGVIVPAMALVVLLGGAGAQIQVQLARRMRFGLLAASDVASQLVGLALAVALALQGAGYWALVAQSVGAAALVLIVRWAALRWKPMRFRRGHGARSMARTGTHYGLAQLLTFAQSNVDTFVIGSQLGAVQLGYYSRAYQSLTAPAGRLLDPLTQVVVSTMNRVKAEAGDVLHTLRRVQFIVGLAMVSMFAVAGGAAPVLIPLVLGDQWGPSIPVFQVLSIGGAIGAFNHVSYWVFIAFERSRDLLTYNLVSKPLAVLLIIVGAQYGIIGVAWAYVAAMAISWPLNLLWLWRSAGLRTAPFASTGLRLLAGGAAAFIATALTLSLTAGAGAVGSLLIAIAAGVLTTVLVTVIVPWSRRDLAAWIAYARIAARGRTA